MSAAEILGELQRRGVAVTVDGDTLCLSPKRAIDDALVARVREAKPAILATLRKFPATCSPECYEVAPGVWVHRSWAGCSTSKSVGRPNHGENLQ